MYVFAALLMKYDDFLKHNGKDFRKLQIWKGSHLIILPRYYHPTSVLYGHKVSFGTVSAKSDNHSTVQSFRKIWSFRDGAGNADWGDRVSGYRMARGAPAIPCPLPTSAGWRGFGRFRR
ncbi:hypothetical protein CEXT_284551 [Caerostris extrusa]|uniref:Uncharacterized protein n=1 Tax=Caerostris extrusa TaxID=172846 RepID=A0AAV4TNG4_CAEEX|nr:hypothetical protein CEXT_284551 [Caerostris extrusa]